MTGIKKIKDSRMKKYLIFAFILLVTLGSTASFAIQQKIKVCLIVADNPERTSFYAGFKSSDLFEIRRNTKGVSNGVDCIERIYKYGPKNISLTLSANNDMVTIVPDASCDFMYNTASSRLKSSWIGTAQTNEAWVFTVTQSSCYENVYDLKCAHTATPEPEDDK